RRRGRRGHLRQPVPLHRLPEHHQGRAPGRRPDRGGDVTGPTRPPGESATRHDPAGPPLTGFGAAMPRREDPRLLTGQGRYLDDLGRDALAAAFVRSPHAHARVTGIEVDDALEVEGLVAVYTWEDLPGRVGEPLPLLIPHPALTHGRTAY